MTTVSERLCLERYAKEAQPAQPAQQAKHRPPSERAAVLAFILVYVPLATVCVVAAVLIGSALG